MKIKKYLAWAIGKDLKCKVNIDDIDIHWEEKDDTMIQCQYKEIDFEVSFDDAYIVGDEFIEIVVHRDGSIASYTLDL